MLQTSVMKWLAEQTEPVCCSKFGLIMLGGGGKLPPLICTPTNRPIPHSTLVYGSGPCYCDHRASPIAAY